MNEPINQSYFNAIIWNYLKINMKCHFMNYISNDKTI